MKSYKMMYNYSLIKKIKLSVIIKRFFFLTFTLFSISAYANNDDCIHQAAICFKVNPLLIKAIIWKESNNRHGIINSNKNNTRDIGIMQINSIHFNSLNKIGINEDELKSNSCANVFSGSWILGKVIDQYGYTWEGIGHYHSKTPVIRDNYTNSIIKIILTQSDYIDSINIPYTTGVREKFSC